MRITKSELQATCVKPTQYPADDMPEIAFAGRSNVGKSSLLNLLTGRKKLARVSGSPGKTRTINFYLINDSFRIVDLPGYGYAKVSKSEQATWGAMMEVYLEGRQNLRKVVQLVDIRHTPSKQDIEMYNYLTENGIINLAKKPVIVNKNKDISQISNIRERIEKKAEQISEQRIITTEKIYKLRQKTKKNLQIFRQ